MNENINFIKLFESFQKIPNNLKNRITKFESTNLTSMVKFLRKKVKLNKSAQKKGYKRFFTDEEKRY